MPAFCCVINCSSNSKRDKVKFFRIPKILSFKHRTDLNELSAVRKRRWLDAINREDFTEDRLKNARICSKHFITGKPASLEDSLNLDWVPSVNMGYLLGDLSTNVDSGQRKNKKKVKIQNKTEVVPSLADQQMETDEQKNQIEENNLFKNQICQTDIDAEELSLLFVKISTYEDTIKTLRERAMCVENLENDDDKIKYYTGLPNYKLFQIILELTKSYIQGNVSLPAEDQILLTLVKIRLNLDFEDIGYRFFVHPTTASSCFENVIHIMARRFKNLIVWPKRSVLQKTTPHCFKQSFHNKTIVIIDCLEMKCERPFHLRTPVGAWSNYKHSETVKYLIGITPRGSICFITEGWAGRPSIKLLTQNPSFLNNLYPGDIVMADRGLLTKEFVEMFNATVKIPAFTRGENQLDAIDLEETEGIGQVRDHVERIIGAVQRKFRILDGKLPVTCSEGDEDKILLDEIVLVASALINLCPPIIPD
ncbi:uncharacterized protein LOC130445669 isoform X1 [Diorhabda sublineata]|uniref:uncharacterized protein LOC130445669 isoform X1 n=1 Tax=Diorhabda sublineata TaxID=1163346 RepID=UPI0024E07379|nr:uncharacterized protein LOC130445669 isoform X1 [Diorhabda sublineata]